jgi:hypothetical protein
MILPRSCNKPLIRLIDYTYKTNCLKIFIIRVHVFKIRDEWEVKLVCEPCLIFSLWNSPLVCEKQLTFKMRDFSFDAKLEQWTEERAKKWK